MELYKNFSLNLIFQALWLSVFPQGLSDEYLAWLGEKFRFYIMINLARLVDLLSC